MALPAPCRRSGASCAVRELHFLELVVVLVPFLVEVSGCMVVLLFVVALLGSFRFSCGVEGVVATARGRLGCVGVFYCV